MFNNLLCCIAKGRFSLKMHGSAHTGYKWLALTTFQDF